VIRYLLSGNVTLAIIIGIVLVVAIALHEFGHALAADLQGDRTPRLAGRLTLNPLAHLDPVGTFFLFIAGFGWGKPVSFSLPSLRFKRAGAAIVALAGPAMNIVLAFVGAALLTRSAASNPDSFGSQFAAVLLRLDVLLAIFNLIPIPPLDGSRLLTLFLPPSRQQIIFFLDKWGFLLLLVFLFPAFQNLLYGITTAGANVILSFFGSARLY
jgi:Zn-dependent protease